MGDREGNQREGDGHGRERGQSEGGGRSWDTERVM